MGRGHSHSKNLDPSLLMWDMRRNLNPYSTSRPADGDTVSVPRTSDVRSALVAGCRTEGEVDLCWSDPGFDVDLYVVDRLAHHDLDLDGAYHCRKEGAKSPSLATGTLPARCRPGSGLARLLIEPKRAAA